ncbi:MAG TPA: FAD:protein FMN transferase [Planctomycetota bacterium]|nr:FAD:protein FMN transferase [Planctomycetota bacterium]
MRRAAGLWILLTACSIPEAPLAEHVFVERHMGTRVAVKVWAASPEQAKRAADAGFAQIAAVDAAMSDYKPDSELNRLNAAAGEGPRPVSGPLFDVLQASKRMAERTDGAFDVTLAPLVLLWRQSRKDRRLPSPEALAEARARSGHADLVLDPAARTAELRRPGMKIDLGGIAKGYACDRALEAVVREGCPRAYVDTGGGMAIGDPPPGRDAWRIGMIGDARKVLLLKNCGVATAGDLEQFVEIEGRRYSHIIDPATGLGLTNRAMATVVAPTGLAADAVDTALCILGPERGFALGGFEAWMQWVGEDGRVRTAQTAGFARFLAPE